MSRKSKLIGTVKELINRRILRREKRKRREACATSSRDS